ncbi:MAG TPA: hypothetical protein VNW29_03600 [Candidatus Sulfotelmatobacter sp.]|jgi:hypothetical protein|nr:hypothetical protein [Candidatus Sulfotelmatobacter sp.]
MLYFSLFFIELLLLFLLSRNLTRVLSHFFYRLTKNSTFTISAIAFLFFPGTVLHEIAHALFAGLLGVRVGTIEFVPKVDGDHIKLGSVQIAQTDPFRRFFIGAAPLIMGTTILLGILFFAAQNHLFANYLFVIFIGYLVFEIGNTMFSSRKDMEGALELFATLIVIVIILYFLGIRVPTFNPNLLFSQPLFLEVFKRGCMFLLMPLIIDTIIIFLLRPIKHKT